MAKSKNTIEQVVICPGAVLGRDFFARKENRLLTLLLKGFIVYLLSMGSIGFYLSAFEIGYNVLLCHMVIFVMSMFCAALYYRLLVENLGYLILLAGFFGLVLVFRDYINSGFYAVVNITVDNAAQYFDIDMQRLYNERIGNRYVTVTFVALFIGIVLDVLLNVYVSRRMQYVTAIFIIMSLNFIPLYLVMEPDLLYVIMVLAGIAMAVIFRAGKHYSPQVSVKRDSRVFQLRGKKRRELAYVYDVRAMFQAGLWGIILAAVVAATVSTVKPKESFNVGYQVNKYKDISMSAASAFLMDGWSAFFRNRNDVGGMDSGKLGTVSMVQLDHQTDLVLEVAPYSAERLYIKNFVGVRYNPYENIWTSMFDMNDYYNETQLYAEAYALRDAYEKGAQGSAQGKLKIHNVDVHGDPLFRPYYTGDLEYENGSYWITYYPRLAETKTNVSMSYYDSKPFNDDDLYVPEENREAVQEMVNQLGFLGDDEDIIQAVKEYYQTYIPYTVRPGKTPRKEDFVNYFLTENKKGYCAHYASAAVLVFRYLGIPARYVEGYAVDYSQILDGELLDDADYNQYYQGYSELGETGVVRVNVTDADAHAWVEVYDTKKGWYPVEVTPTSTEEEEVVAFWDEFADFMDDGSDDADTITDGGNGFVISDKLVSNILYGALGLGGIAILVFFGRRLVHLLLFAIRLGRADVNDKLVMRYGAYIKRLKRKDKELSTKVNYREQILCLMEKTILKYPELDRGKMSTTCERMIGILEQAGFSNRNISDEEYQFVLKYMKFDNHNEWI